MSEPFTIVRLGEGTKVLAAQRLCGPGGPETVRLYLGQEWIALNAAEALALSEALRAMVRADPTGGR